MNILNSKSKPSAPAATVALALVTLFQVGAVEARYAPQNLDDARLSTKVQLLTGKTQVMTEPQLLQALQAKQKTTPLMKLHTRSLARQDQHTQGEDSNKYLSHR